MMRAGEMRILAGWRSVRAAVSGLPCGAGLLLAAGLLLGSTPAAADEEKVLNIYNWSDYIGDNTIRDFEKETGIKVVYDTFDGNEALHAKLRSGHTGYDIVVPSAHWAKRQIEGHLLLKLDKSKITTYGNLDPWLMGQLAKAANDVGNDYVVPWLWGATTVGINPDKVKAALGNLPMPDDAWDLIFKPEYSSRLKNCGLSLLDTGDDVFPAALRYLGKSGFSHDRADYQAAAELLGKLRPNVTMFSSSSYINGLADGSLCIALAWNGDIGQATQRAKAAKRGIKVVALVPRSGEYMYFDTMAIPADAPHVENAYKWISYIYRPEVQAGIVNKTVHANPVRAADKLVSADVRSVPGVFLKGDELAHLAPQEALPDDILRVRTRLFTAFKSGE
jgi:putrescine transport system substrate-binding protein